MWLKYFLRKRLGSECHSFLWKYVHYVSTSILAYYFIINCCLQVLQIYVTPVGPHLSLLRLALTGDIFFMHFLKLSFKHTGMKFSFMSLCDFHDSWGELAPLQWNAYLWPNLREELNNQGQNTLMGIKLVLHLKKATVLARTGQCHRLAPTKYKMG